MSELDPQWIANALFTIIGVLSGWLWKSVKDSIQELKAVDSQLSEKVQHIEVLVAGKYATRAELKEIGENINVKLDKIYQKLDGKADK